MAKFRANNITDFVRNRPNCLAPKAGYHYSYSREVMGAVVRNGAIVTEETGNNVTTDECAAVAGTPAIAEDCY